MLQVSRHLESRAMFSLDRNYGRPKVYDWLLTLPREVKYIWRARWNWSKALYLLTRYTPFANHLLGFQSGLLPGWLAQSPAYFQASLSFDRAPTICGPVDLY